MSSAVPVRPLPMKDPGLPPAQREAVQSIASDPDKAVQKFAAVTGDKTDPAILKKLITSPEWNFSLQPSGTYKVAEFMSRIGLLKTKPASWKDYFFSTVTDGSGS